MLLPALVLMTANVLAHQQTKSAPRVIMAKTKAGAHYSVERHITDRFALTLAVLVPEGVPPGAAHMIEHLLVERDKGQLAGNLEDLGIAISATTTRFQMTISFSGPAGQEAIAFDGLEKMLKPLEIKDEDVKLEQKIMFEEKALREKWQETIDKVYEGATGLPPCFLPEAPSAETILAAQKAMFVQSGLSVCLIGSVDTQAFADAMIKDLSSLPDGPKFKPIQQKILSALGPKANGVIVGPVGSQSYAAAVGAGLMLSKRIPGSRLVIYNQGHASIVTLLAEPSVVKEIIQSSGTALIDEVRKEAETWAQGEFDDDAKTCELRAALMLSNRGRISEFLDSAKFAEDDVVKDVLRAYTGVGS